MSTPKKLALTFEQWKSLKQLRFKHEAEELLGCEVYSDYNYIYPGLLHIEYDPEAFDSENTYSMVVGRCDFYSSNLVEVEKFLYCYYLEESCISDDYNQERNIKLIAGHKLMYGIANDWYW